MLDISKQIALRSPVASQFVGHDYPRHILQAVQEALEETLGSLGVAPALNQNVEYNSVLIHGTPEIVLDALDPDEHLVQMPLVSRLRSAPAQPVCESLPTALI